MALDRNRLEKRLRKLARGLEKTERAATPKNVHALRTHCRRVESAVQAMLPGREVGGKAQELMELLAPIRKQAGKVRDLDVFVGFLPELAGEGKAESDKDDKNCIAMLTEHLGVARQKAERRLRRRVKDARHDAQPVLKACIKRLETVPQQAAQSERAMAAALQAEAELHAYPRLTRTTLHPFRLKVKRLLYLLELAEGDMTQWLRRLDEVKDAIGAWHDWSELHAMAAEVLHKVQGSENTLVRRIAEREEKELRNAMKIATELRGEFVGPARGARKPVRSVKFSFAATDAVAHLAG